MVPPINLSALFKAMASFIVAVLGGAGYVVLSGRIPMDFPRATLVCAQQAVGLAFTVGVYGICRVQGITPSLLSHTNTKMLAYEALSGLVLFAILFLLYLIGPRFLSAGAAGLYLGFVPVFSIVGAYIWLGGRPDAVMLSGAGLILMAVFLGYA